MQAPSGERRGVVEALSELMRARYAEAFDVVPQNLQRGAKSLLTSALENRDRELSKKNLGVDGPALQAWRAAYTPPPASVQKSKNQRMGKVLSPPFRMGLSGFARFLARFARFLGCF